MGEKTFSEQEIYAVDFDGTLCENQWPGIGLPNTGLIDYLKQKRSEGAYLILWTCRVENLLEDAIRWCAKLGLYFDAVNENCPYAKVKFGGDSRKIYADHYIDDKNLYVRGTDFSSSASLSGWAKAINSYRYDTYRTGVAFNRLEEPERPTFRDLAKIDRPYMVDDRFSGGVFCCPYSDGWNYERRKWCMAQGSDTCKACWDRPVPEELLEQRRKEGKRCY